MSPLYLYNGKLLVENGALANNINCCCSTGCPTPPCTGIYCYATDLYGEVDCNRAGIHKHTITIPDEYTLPVPINITGNVDDDLLIDGQSASTTYEPGSYIDPNTGCVVAHTIGDQPGPFKDPVHGGITFPMNNRTFEVAARDTQLSIHLLDITICIDPDNTQNVCLPVLVTGCCYSGVDLYCYEKTVTVAGEPSYDCVTRICATGVPQGEDWTQVGGPFDCGCTDCVVTGNCIAYTGWKIIDQSDFVYASGSITYDGGNGLLNDLPNPFTPLFYGSAGEKNFKLQAYCSGGGTWHNLEPWDGTITLCGALGDRYPSQTLNGSWAPQGACSKPVNEDGDFVCDINGQFSSDCPSLVPGTLGDGQAWRDPDHTIAVTFTGAVDGEWTNLNNWQDSEGLSPAASLPGDGANIVITGILATKPTDLIINLGSVNVNTGGSIGIIMGCTDLYCEGEVTDFNKCTDGPVPRGGQVTCSNSCVFDNGGLLNGILYLTNNTIAEFKNGSFVTDVGEVYGSSKFTQNSYSNGYLNGDAKFYNTSHNDNIIEIHGYFYNTSYNQGHILGNAEFHDSSYAANNSDIDGNTDFYNSSYSSGTGEFEWVEYYDTSYNTGTVRSDNNVFFYEDSYNEGTITGVQSNPAECSFFGNSINKSTGIVSSRNSLSIEGKNQGSITIINTEYPMFVYIKGNGINDTTGTITANTIFENVDGNIPRNKGTITGTADFTLGGCNDGGTATTFIPDPPPVC